MCLETIHQNRLEPCLTLPDKDLNGGLIKDKSYEPHIEILWTTLCKAVQNGVGEEQVAC